MSDYALIMADGVPRSVRSRRAREGAQRQAGYD